MLLDFGCLDIQYIKSFHLIIMKLTAFTKLDMRILHINFLSNLKILTRHKSFRLYLIHWAFKTLLGGSFILFCISVRALSIECIGYFAYRGYIPYS